MEIKSKWQLTQIHYAPKVESVGYSSCTNGARSYRVVEDAPIPFGPNFPANCGKEKVQKLFWSAPQSPPCISPSTYQVPWTVEDPLASERPPVKEPYPKRCCITASKEQMIEILVPCTTKEADRRSMPPPFSKMIRSEKLIPCGNPQKYFDVERDLDTPKMHDLTVYHTIKTKERIGALNREIPVGAPPPRCGVVGVGKGK